jgi:hypothetical protein
LNRKQQSRWLAAQAVRMTFGLLLISAAAAIAIPVIRRVAVPMDPKVGRAVLSPPGTSKASRLGRGAVRIPRPTTIGRFKGAKRESFLGVPIPDTRGL